MGDTSADLSELRDDIDRLDDEIVELIGERVRTAEQIAAVKSATGADLVDERREAAVVSRHEDRFEQQGLDPDAGSALAEYLIEVSLEHEARIEGRD